MSFRVFQSDDGFNWYEKEGDGDRAYYQLSRLLRDRSREKKQFERISTMENVEIITFWNGEIFSVPRISPISLSDHCETP